MFPKIYLGIIPPYSVIQKKREKKKREKKRGRVRKKKNKERIKRTNVPT
jgi:hypothetical protein